MPEINWTAIQRNQKKGFGEGIGAEYQPWIRTRDISSRGVKHKILGHTVHRVHHLLSTFERDCFVVFDWNDGVVDIREQFPLHPITETIEIAESLGYRHPARRVKRKQGWVEEYQVRTVDFRLTLQGVDGFSDVLVTFKQSQELANVRTLDKLQIERTWAERRGLPFRIMTERELPQTLVANLTKLRPYRDVRDFDVPIAEAEGVLAYLYQSILSSPNVPLDRICEAAAGRLRVSQGALVTMVFHAIAAKRWRVDLSHPIDPAYPLRELRRGSAQELPFAR